MNIIYIVRGSNGEYDCFVEWDVAAYTSQEMAEEHARLAGEYVSNIRRKKHEYGTLVTPFDATARWDGGAPSYEVVGVPLRDAVPAA
jgi:hypothetical protein